MKVVVATDRIGMQTIHGAWRKTADAVTLVDAHHHLWDLSRHRYPWLANEPETHFFLGSYEPLKRNYLAEDYRHDSRNHNVLMTVHCEAEMERSHQVAETRWITEVNAEPNAIVAHVWLHTGNAEEIIAEQASFPLVRGVRSKPVTSLTPDRKTPGASGTMQDERWLRGFALLEKYGLSWDLRVPFWHLDEAACVAQQFSNTSIILNHTGFPWDRSEEGLTAWRNAMDVIARQPNVHVKISEFGLKDEPWDFKSNRRVVLDAISIFGIERCVFATNFPVAGLRVDYDTLVRSVKRMVEHLSVEDQERLFWRNAIAYYRLNSAGMDAVASDRASKQR